MAFWLVAIFLLSLAAQQGADYMREHHMPAWKVMLFECLDNLFVLIDVFVLVWYVGRKAYLTITREF